MKRRNIKVSCRNGIHYRPAMLIMKAAQLIKDTKVWITYNSKKVFSDSLIALSSLGIMDGDEIIIIVEGKNEEIGIEIMNELFNNLSGLNFAENVFKDEIRNVAKQLKKCIEKLGYIDKLILLNDIDNAFEMYDENEFYMVEAKLKSQNGMHLLTSSLLHSIVVKCFKCTVRLLYTSAGIQKNINPANLWELAGSEISNGSKLIIEATGIGCKNAALSIKNMLENMDNIVKKLEQQKADNSIDEMQLMSEYLVFVKIENRRAQKNVDIE